MVFSLRTFQCGTIYVRSLVTTFRQHGSFEAELKPARCTILIVLAASRRDAQRLDRDTSQSNMFVLTRVIWFFHLCGLPFNL